MDSTLQWNLTCDGLNDTLFVELAQIIEEAVFEDMKALLTNDTVDLVYVSTLCDQTVDNHDGYPVSSLRRLQSFNVSAIGLTTTVSSECDGCSETLFNASNSALTTIVDDGTLTESIQNKTNGAIQAAVSPGVNSSFTVVTKSPTIAPNPTPTKSPIKSTNSPTTTSPINKGPPTSAEPSAQPTTAMPVNQSPPTSVPPTSRPTKVNTFVCYIAITFHLSC
jgi:hypothetical protein